MNEGEKVRSEDERRTREMLKSIRRFTISILLLIAVGLEQTAIANPVPSPGFLVIAPDQEYLANEQVKASWAEFHKAHLTRLVFISLAEDFQREVQARLQGAVAEMQGEGATEIVLIPLVLSEADPHLKKARDLLASVKIRIAPVFGGDPLAGQILEDRVRAFSKEASKERLVVIGLGATSPEGAETMTRELQRLAAGVQETFHLADAAVAVFYHSRTPDPVRNQGNRLAETTILTAIEKSDLRTLVVLFHLGYKHTGSMLPSQKIESLLSGSSVAYDDRGILPDQLVARWLRKAASPHLAIRKEELGIIVMTHGAGEYYNEPILQALEPLRKRYNIEVAFGMADDETLQAAIDKLEARGARRIHVLRLYTISRSLKADTEFVLGLANTTGTMSHSHSARGGPSRVRSGALLSTSGGFDDHPLIAEVLLQRVLEVSQDPARETVILLAHGASKNEDDQFWIKQMKQQAEFIRAKVPRRFRAIKVATVREDWPEKREHAVAEVRKIIEEAGRDGSRVLVISNRLVGAGPYRKWLSGLDYTLNGQGIATHPNLTRWVEEQIEEWSGSLTLQNQAIELERS
jgi:sirohydrochlorin ferrochelatase